MKTEREITMIRGKIVVAPEKLSKKEIKAFMDYVGQLEILVEEASQEDFYGTEGWKNRLGWS